MQILTALILERKKGYIGYNNTKQIIELFIKITRELPNCETSKKLYRLIKRYTLFTSNIAAYV